MYSAVAAGSECTVENRNGICKDIECEFVRPQYMDGQFWVKVTLDIDGINWVDLANKLLVFENDVRISFADSVYVRIDHVEVTASRDSTTDVAELSIRAFGLTRIGGEAAVAYAETDEMLTKLREIWQSVTSQGSASIEVTSFAFSWQGLDGASSVALSAASAAAVGVVVMA
jgi:hypothetical protein